MGYNFGIDIDRGATRVMIDNNTGKQIDVKKLVLLLSSSYLIPEWCTMKPDEHFGEMGGCWSISCGNVIKTGGLICQSCEFADKKKFKEIQGI